MAHPYLNLFYQGLFTQQSLLQAQTGINNQQKVLASGGNWKLPACAAAHLSAEEQQDIVSESSEGSWCTYVAVHQQIVTCKDA